MTVPEVDAAAPVDPLALLLGMDDGLGPGAVVEAPAETYPGEKAEIKATANPQAADLKSPW